MKDKIHFFCSYLNGKKMCWPVRIVLESREGFSYVHGLAGRFKGRQFSVVSNEVSSYLPPGYKLAPGAKAFVPKVGAESRKAQLIRNRIAKIPYRGDSQNIGVSEAQMKRLFSDIDTQARSLHSRTSGDIAWRHYEEDRTYALDYIEERRFGYALGKMVMMIDLIRGAAERENS